MGHAHALRRITSGGFGGGCSVGSVGWLRIWERGGGGGGGGCGERCHLSSFSQKERTPQRGRHSIKAMTLSNDTAPTESEASLP